MPKKNLTKSHFEEIKNDMNTTEDLLNDAEVNAIATKINNVINLPLLKDEEKELKVFAKIVKLIDKKLYKLLPNEYYAMVQDATNGISEEEVVRLEEKLTPIINSKIDIPILNEKMEAKIISLILGIILNALVDGLKLDEKKPA